MADEVYSKVGRGGAGNFYSKKDVVATTPTDLEAQSPTTTPNTTTEYQHTGRGGAGNWVAPSSLADAGLAQTISTPSTSTENMAKQAYKGGRGGAGNFHDREAEERARSEEEERRRRENEGAIVRDVEKGLARPERAYKRREGVGRCRDMYWGVV
ncbi:hypothetical protein BJ878DRAFT_202945 [Calycina marina]|uniref:Uncharacterized protein n=1 Tax=Calycina marina TaxID=1763456 RepID=A0A9P7YY84_9HELO|nr:hypothetical protein BJ878DRAFT_202945 [Calycina marina]